MDRITLGAFHALVAGAGRPLIYLHGFPDHPPTAGALLAELARHGHRVLAPWLRGYAPSPTTGAFELDALARDVRAMIDQWSPDQPVDVVGHDWGAAIALALCAAGPDRIARAATLALPHLRTYLAQLRTPRQLRRSWYALALALPGGARLASARDLALIGRLWRTWSPGFTLDAARRRDLYACLAASLPGPLGYYRAIARQVVRGASLGAIDRPITTPVLELYGADDGCVVPPTLDDHHRFAGPRVRELIPDVGHFLQLETPIAIAARLATWFATGR